MFEMGNTDNRNVELTVAVDKNGQDAYNFGERAVRVHKTKEKCNLDECEPLPSPYTLEIEPTLLCNADCFFCSYEQDKKKFKKERLCIGESYNGLTRDTVINVLDGVREAGTTKGIFWSGGGDPLLWPHIIEGVKYAASFADNMIQTNGILLDKFVKNEDNPDDLRAVHAVTVSVYADNAELHKKISGVDSFDKVISNLCKIFKMRERYNLDTVITTKILVNSYNYTRLAEIVRFYHEIGADIVSLRDVQDYNYGGDGPREISVELTNEQRLEMRKATMVSGYNDITLLNFVSNQTTESSPESINTSHCFNAVDGQFACIDARGEVFLGNPEIGDKTMSIGNVERDKWGDIWKSEKHYEVIFQMENNQAAWLCNKALCRHAKANIGVDKYLSENKIYQIHDNDKLSSFL